MPIYGYRCKQCGHEFEILQSIVDAPLKTCPECMGPLQKQLYPVGIVFKGSGFYKTDYGNSGSKTSTSSSGSSESSGGAESSGGGDSSKPKSEPAAAPPKSESKSENSGSSSK